jgi:multiple sugar transport system substrate-binding protein
MAGLERLVQIIPGSHTALRRYLTLFCCFALGLVFVLGLGGCGPRSTYTPVTATSAPPEKPSQATSPALFGTQALTKSSPTPLPAIPATPNEQTLSPLGVTSSELRGVQVSVWSPWIGVDGASFQAILDEFNRTNTWGITANASSYTGFGSLDDAVDAGLTSGNLPNVLVDYGYQARRWDADGVLADLTPYVDDPVWGLSNGEQADFYPAFWSEDLSASGITSSSRRLGLPYYRSAYMIFYNQSWAQSLGFSKPPATPEDFRAQACAAADYIEKSGDKSSLGKGGWLVTTDPGAMLGWIYAFGGNITDASGAGYAFNTPEITQALLYLKGLQESGCAFADASLDPQAALANRQALFVVGSLFDLSPQLAAFLQSGSEDVWTVIPFPSDVQPVVDSYGPSLMVAYSTPEKQLASWLVLEWLVYPPNQARFIQQMRAYPTRQSTLGYLAAPDQAGSQWAQALEYLAEARGEPALASWSMMRWGFSDASTQLFSLQFGSDQIPALLSSLDDLGKEITGQVR